MPFILCTITFCCIRSVLSECCGRKTTINFFIYHGRDCKKFDGIHVDTLFFHKICQTRVCNDGRIYDDRDCAWGSCDINGCNCALSCRGGNDNALENFKTIHGLQIWVAEIDESL